jgi:hypothetical protein
MKRRILSVIIVVVILAGVGVGWWFMKKNDTANGNSNSNTNATANLDNANRSYGALVVERETSYRDIPFALTTASVEKDYLGQSAEDGKRFLIVYYKPVENAEKASSIADWAQTEITLKAANDRSYPVREVKSVSTTAGSYDEGYFWFQVDEDAEDFSLQFGSGDSAQTLDLGF